MKKLSFFALALVSILMVSCFTNYGGDKQPKGQAENPRNSESSFITPAKKPKVKVAQIKRNLEYELAMKNDKNMIFTLHTGHYEVTPKEIEMLAALDANGLISLKSRAVKKTGDNDTNDNYSLWVDVALTPKGEKYRAKGKTYSHIINPDKRIYDSIINPIHDRNAYGELEEEVANDSIKVLFVNFYKCAISSLKNAIKTYGESEFIDTYERAVKITSYLDIVVPGSSLVDNDTFFAGVDLDNEKVAALKVVNVTRYLDCFKVYLDANHSVVYILNKDHNKIFDVVCKMEDNPRNAQTIRTRNKQWSEDLVKQYARLAVEPTPKIQTEEELGIEKEWYAPGLTPVYQKDESRYVYLQEKKYAMAESVPILLYRNVVDKVNNIRVFSTPNVTKLDEDNKILTYTFTATATAVIKKEDISPFQFILQNYNYVTPVTEDNVLDNRNVSLTYCDDCGWFAEFIDGRFVDKSVEDNSFFTPGALINETKRVKEFTNMLNSAQSMAEIEAVSTGFSELIEDLEQRFPEVGMNSLTGIEGGEEFIKATGQFEVALLSAAERIKGNWISLVDGVDDLL